MDLALSGTIDLYKPVQAQLMRGFTAVAYSKDSRVAVPLDTAGSETLMPVDKPS